MPPNKGGKNYKKGKKDGKDSGDVMMIQINDTDGQMVGRVLKSVGDRRFRVYCNDNKERLCRLCGTIRKNEWISSGSLVLISKRELNTQKVVEGTDDTFTAIDPDSAVGREQKTGDILQVIDSRLYSKLKKLPGMNPILFNDIENQEMKAVKKKVADGTADLDDIFDDADDADEEKGKGEESSESDGSDESEKEETGFTKEGLKDRQKEVAVNRTAARGKKYISLSDL